MAKESVGGSAAAGGFRFEVQVGALLAAHALAEHRLRSEPTRPWPLLAGWPTQVGLQTGHPVDDVAAYMQDTGLIVVQAKKGLGLGSAKGSPLGDALHQAVRMFRAGKPSADPDKELGPDWNPLIDRIVIATDASAPATVRENLTKVVARLASAPQLANDEQLTNNAGEIKALTIFRSHVQRIWKAEADSPITSDEFRSFCAIIRVMAFDLQPSGRDLLGVHEVLASVLNDRTQLDSAWATLQNVCQDLAAFRQFSTSEDLRGRLAANGISMRSPEHDNDGTGPAFVPETVLDGPITSGDIKAKSAEADELLKENPEVAAQLYASLIDKLVSTGYPHAASQLLPRLTRAWREAGRHRAAVSAAVAAAWRPVRQGEVPSPVAEDWLLEEELRRSPGEPARSGHAVVAVLRYEAGGSSLADVATQIGNLRDDDDLVGELTLWLGEEAVAARQPEVFISLCDRAIALSSVTSPDAVEFAGRLRIVVAECRHDWDPLLATIEADCGEALYALAHARHGQALAWRNDLPGAVRSYEEAIKRGVAEKMYAEVRNWLYDIRTLRGAIYGPGQAHDTHFTAQSLPSTYKLSVTAGEQRLLARGLNATVEGKHSRAYQIFMRLRHRGATAAALIDHRECEINRGAALYNLGHPKRALDCYLSAGDHKSASTLVQQLPDEPLVPDPNWFTGPAWQTHAAYKLLGEYGDLVPEADARPLFDTLAERLITQGRISGWSNFQANETLLEPLAALAWASSTASAADLLNRLEPLTASGGFRREVKAHVELLLACARVHPDLVAAAAKQFITLVTASDLAVPIHFGTALTDLAPAHEQISQGLLTAFTSGEAPWLAPALVELGLHDPAVVDHVNMALINVSKPREYVPGVTSLGSMVVHVASLSAAGSPDKVACFIAAMLDVALENREPPAGRREAIDAITVVAQQQGTTAFGDDTLARVRISIRALARGQDSTSAAPAHGDHIMGSSAALMVAASRLLLVVSDDEEEQEHLIRTLLLSLLDEKIDDPQLLTSALAQAPAQALERDLLVLAASQSPMIRVLAAHCWSQLPAADHEIGRRLANDPSGVVRRALAHGLNEHMRPHTNDVWATLSQDSRYTVRAIARGNNCQPSSTPPQT
ncbi:hypothetical protein [Amycolatopsis thailandensis]|uniref:hypothetical protein n=1 Tax=Amycolatopsis thailandensis TaxID=589330 RepID=UPI00363CC051